jgi:hypothetical protein
MIYGISNNAQFLPLAWAILLGVVCGVLWDVLRFFRRLFPIGQLGLFAEDILFFAVWGLLTFLLCYVTNFGVVRAYILFAQPFGFVLWYCLPGKLTFRLADWWAEKFRHLVIYPSIRFFCFVYRIFFRVRKKFAAKREKFRKKPKKSKKNILKLQKKACKQKRHPV